MNQREYQRWEKIHRRAMLIYVVPRAIIWTIVFVTIQLIFLKVLDFPKDILWYFLAFIITYLINWFLNQKKYFSYSKVDNIK